MNLDLQILVVALDDLRYGLPLANIDRILRAVEVTPLPHAPDIVWGVIDVRGQVVPVLSLRKRCGLPERAIGVADYFVLARTESRTVALVVDSVSGVIERPMGEVIAAEEILPDLKLITGVARLEDGMALIHDLRSFLFPDEEWALAEAMTFQRNDER